MIRTIHPVGQGGFISEKFYTYKQKETTIVYDCGSLSGKNIVENAVRNSFEQNERIKAVYISHLDNDHVNGLQYLIQYCNVENLFLPYLSPKALLMSMIKYKCQEESGEDNICSTFTVDLIYYSIARTKDVFPNIEQSNYEKFPEIHFIYPDTINLQSVSVENSEIWQYLAFNNENRKIEEEFFDMLKIEEIPESLLSNMDSFITLWENLAYRNCLKKIYKKLSGGINANSLGLMSYPLRKSKKDISFPECRKRKYLPSCYYHIINLNKVGAIYVGDMDLSDESSVFYEYRFKNNNLSLLQLPHHGSYKNYHPKCLDYMDIFIVNSGYTNPYGHPSPMIIDDILVRDKDKYIVTEHPGSIYREHIMIEYKL